MMMTSKHNIQFDEESHVYTVDGKTVPSVTEILKPLSADTAEFANPILREQAANRGSRVHEATIFYDYNGMDDEVIEPDIYPYIKAYADFIRDYRIKYYILTECPVSNGEYAGTLDRLAFIDGKYTVIDFKTGTTVDPRKESAQLYAYAQLLAENGFATTESYKQYEGFILRLKKDGTYTVQNRDLETGKLFFDKCKELYFMIKEDKSKHGKRKS